jgi:hypothetical protein
MIKTKTIAEPQGDIVKAELVSYPTPIFANQSTLRTTSNLRHQVLGFLRLDFNLAQF